MSPRAKVNTVSKALKQLGSSEIIHTCNRPISQYLQSDGIQISAGYQSQRAKTFTIDYSRMPVAHRVMVMVFPSVLSTLPVMICNDFLI